MTSNLQIKILQKKPWKKQLCSLPIISLYSLLRVEWNKLLTRENGGNSCVTSCPIPHYSGRHEGEIRVQERAAGASPVTPDGGKMASQNYHHVTVVSGAKNTLFAPWIHNTPFLTSKKKGNLIPHITKKFNHDRQITPKRPHTPCCRTISPFRTKREKMKREHWLNIYISS